VSKYQNKLEDKVIEKDVGDIKLSDLDIGPPISKGCNAVVYASALKNQQHVDPVSAGKFKAQRHDTNVTNEELNFFSPARSLPNFIQNLGGSVDNINQYLNEPSTSHVQNTQRVVKFNEAVKVHATRSQISSSSSADEGSSDETTSEGSREVATIYQYPWALKMMFNYDIQSNAMSILRAMYKETVPARCRVENQDIQNWERSLMDQTASVPAHPNLVLMPAFFCDYIPKLKNSHTLYPNALPQRLNPSTGYGRNMSLFLLMKRYDSTLSEYLADNDLDVRTKVILFAQLLEAVAHINHFQVAHRDLKSDNILIDMSTDSLPILGGSHMCKFKNILNDFCFFFS
jgi:PTEN induced putative kinase 1